ncbi:ASKHA domain-containing protein [Eubacteriaceae bacterium ES2]|nr:ASKHA domain-containing protein [Eubacteriaceae bacterium ES2]
MNGLIRKVYRQISPPGNGDIRGDRERILDALSDEFSRLDFSNELLKKIYPLCRDANWEITLTLINEFGTWRIIELEPANQCHRQLGFAVDLGSTSVAMRLFDLTSREILGEDNLLNKQIQFGDDILTRIFHVKNREDQLRKIQSVTIETLNLLMTKLAAMNHIEPENVTMTVISGNTTMIHFLMGVDPWPIFEHPYAPVFNEPGYFLASEMGFKCRGAVYCLPSVANYLGGDTLGGLLTAGLHQKDELGLFIDIGTNGEMVLGNKDFLVAGAGAAGPALEGGISQTGMKAMAGAVDSVLIENNQLHFTTIAGRSALGICGSGIVDLIAQMLLNGWIDFSGRFNPNASDRITKREGQLGICYAWATESGSGKDLLFTETDLKQFIDTKAAAGTMVSYLLERVGVAAADVDRIYVSGAFGTYINLESAITIGLYPDLPRERFVFLGNSSLEGATLLLSDRHLMAELTDLQKKIEYLEFGAAIDFLSRMYAARFLPHTNLNDYPSVKANLIKRGILTKR